MDEAACYVFRSQEDRPAKRRRLNSQPSNDDLRRRQALFLRQWQPQERRFDKAISGAQEATLGSLTIFVNNAFKDRSNSKIPTGLLVTGSSTSFDFLKRISTDTTADGSNVFITLSASDGANLKTLLKVLIYRATQENNQDSDDEEAQSTDHSKGSKLLNYDLQILYEWVKLRQCQNVIIAVQDSETLDVNVLSDFIVLLHAWLNRLPIVLIIGIATSTDMFHDRLPSSALRCMSGEEFDVAETDNLLEEVFECCTAIGGAQLHVGPELGAATIQRSKDHLQGAGAFRQSIKYAYVCNSYGNPASVFTAHHHMERLNTCDYEAVRNLPSFRQHVEQLLELKQAAHARQLLQSDHALDEAIQHAISSANAYLEWLCGALKAIQHVRKATSTITCRPAPAFSSLYIKTLSGSLAPSSPSIRELLLSIRKLDSAAASSILKKVSDTLMQMPPTNIHISPDDFSDLSTELEELVVEHGPLQASAFDTALPAKVLRRTPTNTPARSGTTSTSRHSPQHQAYTKILSRLHNLLSTYLNAVLPTTHYTLHPRLQFLHEILFLNTKIRSLYRSAFTPAPRAAMERALSSPRDYLGERHDEAEEVTVNGYDQHAGRGESTRQAPATAILYQLYLESGALINVADLWTAFQARIRPLHGAAGVNDCSSAPVDADEYIEMLTHETSDTAQGKDSSIATQEPDDATTHALFARALAELKYMGMVKPSRRKADCVQKVMWQGL